MNAPKEEIKQALLQFADGNLADNAKNLLNVLGYESQRTMQLDPNTSDGFLSAFELEDEEKFNPKRALVEEWESIDLLFQLTEEEIRDNRNLEIDFGDGGIDEARMESYLFFAIKLNGNHYTRTQLSQITREMNKPFDMPAMILFQHGGALTFAVIDRRLNRRDESKDVLLKATLIKDINFADPHRAHIDILSDLSIAELHRVHEFSNFPDLHEAWKKTLDTEALNKQFYQRLFDWFEWAISKARFPENEKRTVKSEEHVIRLITRLLFIWFIKEKGLVANELFDEKKVGRLLKGFKPDSGDSYYRAVLQNLFFATLNTEIEKRGFSPRTNAKHRNFSLYRYKQQISAPDKLLTLFAQTPFINGGLFDCLDSEEATRDGGYRIDCFSDEHYKKLSIPNSLFFDDDRGLIPLLNHYKFTVEENTPIEQEVALDPELLGKVFENLLAAYNPETGATARKQTGSYYTPRVIVDYIVEEVLVAILTGQVSPTDGDAKFWEERLRYLFDYAKVSDDASEWFDSRESDELVRTISELKILDPAVGSGAFPMGILHKLTLALQRLDWDNTRWEQLQKERAIQRAAAAFDTKDRQTRDEELKEISRIFENYSGNFGRKLYLIQNSIFGLDIQSIACQIAKLRFFISLAIEQEPTSEANNNFGIKPLPNLETRFVAANTLIGLDVERTLTSPKTKALEGALGENRERHFHATTRSQKLACKKEDKRLRGELAKELKHIGMPADDADKVVAWDPYDQNSSADWFDLQRMFDITDGFDIVIGNPPYVRADSGAEYLATRRKLEESKEYKTLYEKWDLMVPFIEKGLNVASGKGDLAFIVSNAICTSKYASKLLDWLQKEHFTYSINYFEDMAVFEAGVIPVVLHVGKGQGHETTQKVIRRGSFENIISKTQIPAKKFKNLGRDAFRKEFNPIVFKIKTINVGDICYLSYGLRPNSDERYWKGEFTAKDIISDRKDETHSRPYAEGKDIENYLISRIRYLEWDTNRVPRKLVRPTFPELYERPKIMRGCLTGGIYDNSGLICNHSIVVFVRFTDFRGVNNKSIQASIKKFNRLPRAELERISENFDLKYILAVLNSSLASFYLNNIRRHRLENYFYPDDLRRLLIADISLKEQEAFINLVDEILSITKEGDYFENTVKQAEVREYKKQIDNLIYKLYDITDEEIAIVEENTV